MHSSVKERDVPANLPRVGYVHVITPDPEFRGAVE